MISVTLDKKFDSKTIYNEWIGKDWKAFQGTVRNLGGEMLSYIQSFIIERSYRNGKTGNLARSIKLYNFGGAGQEEVGWGLGKMSEMDKLAPYWYLINFGGMSFIAQYGLGVGGSFNGVPPASGIGTQRWVWGSYQEGSFVMFPKSPISPMNYIEATRLTLDNEMINLLNKMTKISEARGAR